MERRATTTGLPLLPMQAVLVPGAEMRVRLTAPAHRHLVRECSRASSGFGVRLQRAGDACGAAASPVATGTEARITDFATTAGIMLDLTVEGGRRFDVERTRIGDTGLVFADVRWRPTAGVQPVRPEHGVLPMLLERMLDRFGGRRALVAGAAYDDADWVAWRLCELLPLTTAQRQSMLVVDDPHARLAGLLELVPALLGD